MSSTFFSAAATKADPAKWSGVLTISEAKYVLEKVGPEGVVRLQAQASTKPLIEALKTLAKEAGYTEHGTPEAETDPILGLTRHLLKAVGAGMPEDKPMTREEKIRELTSGGFKSRADAVRAVDAPGIMIAQAHETIQHAAPILHTALPAIAATNREEALGDLEHLIVELDRYMGPKKKAASFAAVVQKVPERMSISEQAAHVDLERWTGVLTVQDARKITQTIRQIGGEDAFVKLQQYPPTCRLAMALAHLTMESVSAGQPPDFRSGAMPRPLTNGLKELGESHSDQTYATLGKAAATIRTARQALNSHEIDPQLRLAIDCLTVELDKQLAKKAVTSSAGRG